MKKVRFIWFQTPTGWEGVKYYLRHPVALGIALSTWSRFIHMEVWTPNEREGEFYFHIPNRDFSNHTPVITGRMWTSTLRGDDGENGACWRPAAQVLHNPERWCYKEFEVKDEDYESMILAMEHAVATNAGYDKELIAMMAMGFKTPFDPRKLICSEFARVALLAAETIHLNGIVDGMQFVQSIPTKGLFPAHSINPKLIARALPGPMIELKG